MRGGINDDMNRQTRIPLVVLGVAALWLGAAASGLGIEVVLKDGRMLLANGGW